MKYNCKHCTLYLCSYYVFEAISRSFTEITSWRNRQNQPSGGRSPPSVKLDAWINNRSSRPRVLMETTVWYIGHTVVSQNLKTGQWDQKATIIEKRPNGRSYVVNINGRKRLQHRRFLRPSPGEYCERQTLQSPDIVETMLKNPRKVFPSYNTRIHVKVREIEDFLIKHAAITVSLNPRKTQ